MQWQQESGPPVDIPSFSITSSLFVLPTFSLSPSQTYVFKCTCTAVGEEDGGAGVSTVALPEIRVHTCIVCVP